MPACPRGRSGTNALLGPRFLATAFAAGPALMIIILALIRRHTAYSVADATLQKLALVVTVAAQVCLVMLVSELFTEFYRHTHHASSARYLFFGLEGHRELVPWIWTSIGLTVARDGPAERPRAPRTPPVLYLACAMLFVGVLIDKGMGTIIPGFVPEPWGSIPTTRRLGRADGVRGPLGARRVRLHGARQGRHSDRAGPRAAAAAAGCPIGRRRQPRLPRLENG